jgi:hypothetical protein
MNIHDMSTEQLLNVEITSVEFGRQLAEEIRLEQVALHREMIGLEDNVKWQELCDRRYDLRKVRFAVLHLTGELAIQQHRVHKR